MVSYSYEEAVRKLVSCDSPFEWDESDSPHPNIDPDESTPSE